MPSATALSHLRVIDLTRVRAGPTCVKQFADFGDILGDFFGFGGVSETARWLRKVIEGSFELDSAQRGFSINK